MRIFAFAALISGGLAGPAVAVTTDSFTGFVGFSDSINDEGRIIGQLNFPSLGDRFSDAPVWFERVGERFENRGLTDINLSLGGATAGPQFDDPTDPTDNVDLYAAFDASPLGALAPIPLSDLQDFDSQIDTYLALGEDVGDNPLFAISLGGNDVIQRGPSAAEQILTALVNGITRLATQDTSVHKTFLVSNLIDPLAGPGVAFLSPAEQAEIAALSALVVEFNTLLATQLSLISIPNVTIEVFDFFSTFNGIVEEAKTAGLKTAGFCVPEFLSDTPSLLTTCLDGSAPSTFLFGDPVHPLSFAHERLAAATIAQLEDRLPPVPLPAGLPLLAGGLGLLWFQRRRAAGDGFA